VRTPSGTYPVRSWGDPGSPPVLALHGFPQTSLAWAELGPVLGDAGYHVVAFDQRGYSAEARPAEDEGYLLGHLVGDVVDVAEQLGLGAVHLLGHDWGGWVAWHLAASRPDLLRSLSVVCTPHPAALAAAVETDPAQSAAVAYLADLATPGAAAVLLADDAAWLRSAFAGTPRPDEHLAAAQAPGMLDAALGWYRARGWQETELGDVTVPTLYVWPELEGGFLRSSAEQVAAHVSGRYRHLTVPGAGHWVAETHPEAVASALLEHWRHAA
jgi:pimeloyl-ACP methyl ester carboxylesterase